MERGVPHILEVGDADFAGVKAVGGEIAQEREEGHSLAGRGDGDFVQGVAAGGGGLEKHDTTATIKFA